MPFGQVVIGPPGSGKSTYCNGLQQFHTALNRPIILINLDPAAPSPPYPSSLSITDLITLDDAMSTHGLGPNGAMLFCLEYLEINFQWLLDELERILVQGGWTGEKREEVFVVFDTPGQVELSTDHGSLKRIIERLAKEGGWRLAAVHLMDANHILDPSKYVAILLLSLRTMLQLELPHINVLSKVDLLQQSAAELRTFSHLPFVLRLFHHCDSVQSGFLHRSTGSHEIITAARVEIIEGEWEIHRAESFDLRDCRGIRFSLFRNALRRSTFISPSVHRT